MVGQPLSDNSVVDSIKELTGDDLTIFQGDTRINTTVVKPDGTRAIGTKLDPEISDILLKQGKEYYGDAVVLGTDMKAVYKPLRNNSDEILGVITSYSIHYTKLYDIK